MRTGSRKLAVLTLVFDAGKGAVAVGVANYFADIHSAALAGLLTVIGHCFPVWLKFQGGKGVATSLAVFTALDIRLGGVFAIIWLATAFLSRYSSLAALSAVLAVTVGGFVLLDDMISQICILLLSGLVWTHDDTPACVTAKGNLHHSEPANDCDCRGAECLINAQRHAQKMAAIYRPAPLALWLAALI